MYTSSAQREGGCRFITVSLYARCNNVADRCQKAKHKRQTNRSLQWTRDKQAYQNRLTSKLYEFSGDSWIIRDTTYSNSENTSYTGSVCYITLTGRDIKSCHLGDQKVLKYEVLCMTFFRGKHIQLSHNCRHKVCFFFFATNTASWISWRPVCVLLGHRTFCQCP